MEGGGCAINNKTTWPRPPQRVTPQQIITFPQQILKTRIQTLHFGQKHRLALNLPVLGLQLFNQGQSVPLLLLPLLFQILTRYFQLRLIALLRGPEKREVARQG